MNQHGESALGACELFHTVNFQSPMLEGKVHKMERVLRARRKRKEQEECEEAEGGQEAPGGGVARLEGCLASV